MRKFFLTILFLSLVAANALANTEIITFDDDVSVKWNLEADTLRSLEDGAILEAEGNISLDDGNNYLKADYARYYTASNWVYIKGNVEAKLGKDVITASEAEFDLQSKKGWLKNGYIFMDETNIHFKGERLNKYYGDRYSFENAKVTSCDGDVPAWSFEADEMTVDVDGYAQLIDSSFLISDNTVLYTPYMVLPAKKTRQMGLLKPEFSYSSLLGASAVIPYYYPPAENYDFTFYLGAFQHAGVMPSVEFRSITSDTNKAWFTGSYLYSDKIVTNDANDKINSSDGLIRTNHSRYWLRGMTDGTIASSGWKYKINLDLASDRNFLREFKNTMVGFDETSDQLYNFFGRELSVIDANRVSEGLVYKDWQKFGLSFGMRYEQNLSIGNGNLASKYDESTQRLPEIYAFYYKSNIVPELPLELEAQSSATYFHRNFGTSGMRLDINPKISIPLKLDYASFIATAGLRLTDYSQVRRAYTSPLEPGKETKERQRGRTRFIPSLNLVSFSEANRVYDIDKKTLNLSMENAGKSETVAFRHVIQPKFEYSFIPKVKQEEFPFYDIYDRILERNEINFYLTNIITTKKRSVLFDKEAENGLYEKYDYIDTLWVRLGIGYDFNEADRKKYTNLYPNRPVKDLTSEIQLALSNKLSLSTKNSFSLYDFNFNRSDIALNYRASSWLGLTGGYSYRSKDYNYRTNIRYNDFSNIYATNALSLITAQVNLNITDKWSIYLLEYFDINKGTTNEFDVALSYTEQCYRYMLGFKYTPTEKIYYFSVDLIGLFS